MSYVFFVLAFVALPLALLWWRARHGAVAGHGGAWLVTLAVAVPAAIVWDHQAAQWGMWRWSASLTLGWRWWGLPVEEVAFVLLLVVLVVALCAALRGMPPLATPWRRGADVVGFILSIVGVGCAVRALQLARLPGHAHPMYLPYLLMAALPVLALQWLVGGRALWRTRHLLVVVATSVAIWYTLADALALRVGIWSFAAVDLAGPRWGDVPSEETVFFAAVALLVAQTYLILLTPGWSSAMNRLGRVWLALRRALVAVPRQTRAPALGGSAALSRRRGI